MATSYPTGLDAMTTLVDNVDQILAAHQNDRADAIEAIETKVGIDSSAVITSIDYFLKHASGAYRIHQHDATSDDGAKLDWDNCWTDAVHDHSSNAEGGAAIDVAFLSDYTRTKQGDWITSTVTTARTGWTNVSATYSNKFLRINATPLTTGGADTHTTPSHTLTVAEMPSHTHTVATGGDLGGTAYAHQGLTALQTFVSGSAGGGGGHTHTAADNVPAYVQVVIFQKD